VGGASQATYNGFAGNDLSDGVATAVVLGGGLGAGGVVLGTAARSIRAGSLADDTLRSIDNASFGNELIDAPNGAGTCAGGGVDRLAGANRAQIDPAKITEYALNPAHPVVGNKARVFDSAIGFNQPNADDLIAQLQTGVMNSTPIPGTVDKWGSRFTVDIRVTGPNGSGVVRTGWIYDPGSLTPRLATAYVR